CQPECSHTQKGVDVFRNFLGIIREQSRQEKFRKRSCERRDSRSQQTHKAPYPSIEIVQNKPGLAIREGGPTRRVSHAWRPATRQLRKTADKPVLRDTPIHLAQTSSRQRRTPLQDLAI